MGFWLFFYSMIALLGLYGVFFNTKYQKQLYWTMLFLVWFIVSFRYMIGTDYLAYAEDVRTMYFSHFSDILDVNTELIPALVIYLIQSFGLGFQVYFIVFETLLIFFMYYGLKQLTQDNRIHILFFMFYCFTSNTGGMFFSTNGVRQSCAVSIVFLAICYLLKQERGKFLLFVALASLVHMSAWLALIIYPLRNCKLTAKKCYAAALVSLLISVSGLNIYALNYFFSHFDFYKNYSEAFLYFSQHLESGVGISTILYLICFLLVVYITKNYESDQIGILNFNGLKLCAMLYTCIFIICSVRFPESVAGSQGVGSIFHRLEVYFLYFYLLFVACAISSALKFKVLSLISTFMVAMVFYGGLISYNLKWLNDYRGDQISTNTNESAHNINYRFNFDILE